VRNRYRQRGFSIVSAIFLVVVVSLLAGYMVNIGTATGASMSMRMMGARATAAAHSGMEWAAARVVADNACFSAGTRFALNGTALNGFEVTADCSMQAVTEGQRSYRVFQLTATARYGAPGKEDNYQRRLTAAVANVQ
jgi:MSHA biogenesis protein MshP